MDSLGEDELSAGVKIVKRLGGLRGKLRIFLQKTKKVWRF